MRADNDTAPSQEADALAEMLEATPAISPEPIDNEPSAPQQAEVASEVTVTVGGEGNTTFAARLQNFHYYSTDHVEPVAISSKGVAACADERFVPPTTGLRDAAAKLAELGIVVLLAPAGSGRRTTALRLLCDTRGPSDLYDLEAAWQRPNVKCLQNLPDGGFLLDLSEPADKPAKRGFGTELLQWAAQRKQQGSRIVIITTHNTWSGPWADEARDAVVELGSPDAKTLVERELAVRGVAEGSKILDNPIYKPIWDSAPRAEDACRLAKMIASSATADPRHIIDQYQGWKSFFDTFPQKLHARIVLWSGALCNGGRRESVLRMSDALIGELGDDRTPREILGGDISSKRFASAFIKENGDRVELDPGKQGLSSSVLRHFWQEFPTQHKRFVGWATSQAAELPADDAALVVDALVDLGIHYRAGEVFKQLRDTLAPKRRALAVRALSTAALDERFGSYMRSRLYTWLYGSPTQDVIDLVAEVCGGSFGAKMPGPALARLRLAGERSVFASEAVSTAWVCLATAHPQLVRAAIESWLADGRYPRAGLVAFMALAATSAGSALLLGEDGHELRSDETHAMVVTSLRRALAEPDAMPIADSIIRTWAAQAEQRTLPGDVLIDLLGAVFTGDRYQDLKRFLPEERLPDPGTFWHAVLSRAFYPLANEASVHDTLVRAG
ncbi:hypothetical protein [Nonomuraea soli]|uniref:Uncharacterized protein n=1 Tax=Nonomuraea soli TaxID=1032476 RepID=A0A7W0HQW2_9ACTN|nr:hypothetical protein [Nonomuraea soli]MBA2892374.1 hypothetical protein [Nonomuraea soli]